MKRFNYSFLVFQIWFVCLNSFSQVQDIKFKRFATRDGLSQENVLMVKNDHRGFLWFGTVNGLNRYDGYQFRIFSTDPFDSTSISDNWIYSICPSRTGDVWVGTQKGGLNRYEHTSGEFHSYKNIPGDSLSLPDNGVTSIIEDADGILWIGTLKGELCWMDPSGTAIHHFEKKPHTVSDLKENPINSMLEDANGNLWINSARGLLQVNKNEKYSGKYVLHEIRWNNTQQKGNAYWPATLYKDSHGTIYVGTTGGLYYYDKITGDVRIFTIGEKRNIIDVYVSSICEDRTGSLWVGTSDKGVYLIDEKRETYRHIRSTATDNSTLISDVIFSICEDDAGTMWFGTFSGISCYDRRQKPFFNYLYKEGDPNGLSNGNVMDIREDSDGGLWLATHGGGLNYLPHGSDKFRHFRYVPNDPASLSTNMLLCMSGNSRDILWIGSRDGGLMKFNKRTKKTERFLHDPNDPSSLSDNVIFYLYEDRKENLWIGTATSGVDKLEKATGKFVHYRYVPNDTNSLSGNVIWAILEDSKGFIWIGTQFSGLNRLDPRTGKCTRYLNRPGDAKSLQTNSIYALHEYPPGVLWIATAGGTLDRFDGSTNEFTLCMQKERPAINDIASILHDLKGRLWLGTASLVSFDPITGKVSKYDDGDGIKCGAFNQEAACVGRDGRMYFGGADGFFVFHPDSINKNTYIPPIVLTDFKVFENSRRFPGDSAAGIVLSYEENYFSFEFAALSFTSPENNMYRYILEGYDKDWISCGTRRYASYTHVDPGDYVFRVQGSNEDGVWNTKGAAIAVHVIPPYWKTFWFRIFAILIFVFAAAYIIRRRFKFLEQQTRYQQELSRRLLESQENERKRIGTSLHDSLGQNLLVIKNLAVMAIDAVKNKKDTVQHMSDISSLASNVLAEVREIAYNLRPYHIDQLGLTGALRSIISRIEESSQIQFAIDLDDLDNLFPHEQDINVFRIVQEALNNIIKHSKARNASVNIKRIGDNIVFTIKDDGAGFAHQQRGFGLTGMEERTRILGGSIDIKSSPGAGSTIVVTIPVRSSNAEE